MSLSVSDTPVFFAEARETAGLEPIASGTGPAGAPVPGVDFVAPLVCNPLNTVQAVVSTAGSLFARGLPDGGSKFDWRDKMQLAAVAQQGKCGGCWAFAVAGCLSDREAVIAANARGNLDLSPVELIECAQECQPECGTCSPVDGFAYAKSHGVPSSLAEDGQKIAELEWAGPGKSCDGVRSSYAAKKAKARVYAADAARTATSIDQIKKEIAARGPVCSVFRVFRDFIVGSDPRRGQPAFHETGGVYAHADLQRSPYAPAHSDAQTTRSMGDLLGYHAVVLVGWGEQEIEGLPGAGKHKVTTPFWIARNSWGDKWGDKGYFKCAFSSATLNQSVGMDLPVTDGKASLIGGVFFAPVKGPHGCCFWPAAPGGTSLAAPRVFRIVIASVVVLTVVFLALALRRCPAAKTTRP